MLKSSPCHAGGAQVSTVTFTGDGYVQGLASFVILTTEDNVRRVLGWWGVRD